MKRKRVRRAHRVGEGLFIDLRFFRPDPVTEVAVSDGSKFENS